MHNLLILGTGRSGTSMTAALFRDSGYFFGDHLLQSTRANPFGYYEDYGINVLNNQLIKRLLLWKARRPLFGWTMPPVHRDERAFWLAAPRYLVPRGVPRALRADIQAFTTRQPFCYKDPRFNLTLPSWRPHLPEGTRFLVVFRDPERTTDSILRDASESYRTPLAVSAGWAYRHWERNYRRLLDQYASQGEWLFVEYDAILDGTAIPALQAFSGARLNTSQIDPSVSRSKQDARHAGRPDAQRCRALLQRLRECSAQDLRRWSAEGIPAQSPTGQTSSLGTGVEASRA